jgi:hypothetical protein
VAFFDDLADKIERDYGKRLDQMRETLERAKKLGTLDKVDRTPQYEDPSEWAKPEKLLTAVNVQGNHVRRAQKDIGEVRHDVQDLKLRMNLQLRNTVVTAIVTAVLMKAPEIFSFLYRLTQ